MLPRRMANGAFPLISTGASLSRLADGSVEILRTLDPAHDLYLNDHRLDGKPVFPMAMALELMAEAAAAGWPDLEVVEMKDLRLLRGLVLENGSKPVRVVAKPLGIFRRWDWRSRSVLRGWSSRHRSITRPSPDWGSGLPHRLAIETLSLSDEVSLPFSLEEVYRQWLFHGPLMAGIAEIQGIGTNGIAGT